MKRVFGVAAVILALACSKETPAAATSGEETYAMTATIVSRDPGKNMLNLNNKEVPGKMMAMKMEYEVRDAKVAALPADGTAVQVTVHDKNGSVYITNVKPAK